MVGRLILTVFGTVVCDYWRQSHKGESHLNREIGLVFTNVLDT